MKEMGLWMDLPRKRQRNMTVWLIMRGVGSFIHQQFRYHFRACLRFYDDLKIWWVRIGWRVRMGWRTAYMLKKIHSIAGTAVKSPGRYATE